MSDFATSTQQASGSSPVRVATCVANDRLTPADWFQDTRHLAFTLDPPAAHAPGDVLHVLPENSAAEVDR